jgi:hypothetical protein
MATFIKLEDFSEGRFYIAYNSELCQDIKNLQSYIDTVEHDILRNLFGSKEMVEDFIAKFDSTSGTFLDISNSTCGLNQDEPCVYEPYQKIYDELIIDCGCTTCHCKKDINDGLVDILKGFVFFYYMRDYSNKLRSLKGIVNKNSDSSEDVSINEYGLITYYNNSIDDYNVIGKYLRANKNDYPLYISTRVMMKGGSF